ncbi:MAG: endopeptidase La [Synergistaceae bacterium]|nr:endopeptidase La [Synergistaceae bacterium]
MSSVYPLLPLKDMVIFPGMILPIFTERERSVNAIDAAVNGDKRIFLVLQKTDDELPDPECDLHEVGVLCEIQQSVRMPDGAARILVEGERRMSGMYYLVGDDKIDYIQAEVDDFDWEETNPVNVEPWRRSVMRAFNKYNELQPKIPEELMNSINSVRDPEILLNLICSHLVTVPEILQKILEQKYLDDALELLLKLLFDEIDLLKAENKIEDEVQSQVDKNRREYYLRERLKAVKHELNEIRGKSGSSEINDNESIIINNEDDDDEQEAYARKIANSKMSDEAREKANKELAHLSKMFAMSAESAVIRSYLDWLLDLPWEIRTEDNLNIAKAAEILDKEHYGLRKVKDRILEFLAVRRKAGGDMSGQIICLVGPPGVGKTSLGRSVANALSRNFVNVALGGVRDEAEIRGHRRTYIGSLPGRIIQKVAQAKSCNPVILLDEIDKLGSDFRGDPASALLEVLDPRQNMTFTDHYLEVPFDLSEALFITTANVTHTIPPALLDRMEIISLPGYVTEEKVKIAAHYLLPRGLKEHGLKAKDVKISGQVIKKIISSYTREAGVRNLDRALAAILRKVTRKLVELEDSGDTAKTISVKAADLTEYLGPDKLYDLKLAKEPELGSVTGLAWTNSGGDVLIIEAVIMKGKGELILTGNLGDVMQESAKAAVSYLRSQSEVLGINKFKFKEHDIHVHVPEGAVPKDGPSAGITMATAILSAVSGRKVKNNIAMTGEISLRGKVLPIGGVREKILAARRHGVKNIILPSKNKPDVEEIANEELSSSYIDGMKFYYVDDAQQVFNIALEDLES